MKSYWMSTSKMTVSVDVDNRDVIVAAAPIVYKFIGQPISNLRNWLSRQGGFKEAILS